MAMIVLSSPATLTEAGKKKTGPSRFRPDFLNGAFDENRSMFTTRAADYPSHLVGLAWRAWNASRGHYFLKPLILSSGK
jgi:hypothetical protein